MLKITILGATGSIGTQTIDVIRLNPNKYELYAIVANSNVDKMFDIIKEFKVQRAALFDEKAAKELFVRVREANLKTEVLSGEGGVLEIAADKGYNYLVSAIVGAAGLKPTLTAAKNGITIGLANKESLVMTGKIFFDTVYKYGSKVVPIDSEHSAIFQSLPEKIQQNLGYCDLHEVGVSKILLTGSGGPFRETKIEDLKNVDAKMAINHPVWKMGPKISVDSSTMMNKGLEFIEARYLFNAKDDDIEVIIHPQSVVHSMVSYVDGAVMAQLGTPDMKTPIARALAYPDRVISGAKSLDFTTLSALTFFKPSFERYPCLYLAMQASKLGQGATTALNAANEECVASFLAGNLDYLGIPRVCQKVLEHFSDKDTPDLESVLLVDKDARIFARKCIV